MGDKTTTTRGAAAAAAAAPNADDDLAELSSPGSDGICDMCLAPHGGPRRLRLLQCRECHLRVHEECYLFVGDEASFWFTCWACQAVGTKVKFRERCADDSPPEESTAGGQQGQERQRRQRLEYLVTERPTECCLCSVDDGLVRPHAMHPLYDDYSTRGRQVRLPSSKAASVSLLGNRCRPVDPLPPRPAWAHTLCCLFLVSSKGGSFLFGCRQDGGFLGEDDDDDDDDDNNNKGKKRKKVKSREEKDPARLVWDDDEDSSVNSALGNNNNDDNGSLHHFVVMMERWYGPNNPSIKETRERQRLLKCIICGDGGGRIKSNNLRVPLQCSANDDDEWKGGEGTHVELGAKECFQAMHVGCAFYGPGSEDGPRCVYFSPCTEHNDGYSALYCIVHAKDVAQYNNDDDEEDVDFLLEQQRANNMEEDDDDEEQYADDDDDDKIPGTSVNRRKVEHPNKLQQRLNRNRSTDMVRTSLTVRASGVGGGGHSRLFGRSTSATASAAGPFRDSHFLQVRTGHRMTVPTNWNPQQQQPPQQQLRRQWWGVRNFHPNPQLRRSSGSSGGSNAMSRSVSAAVVGTDSAVFRGTAQQLCDEITTELVERFKAGKQGDSVERLRITKLVQANWKRKAVVGVGGGSMTPEVFKKVFDKARIRSTNGEEKTRTLYKRDIPNPGVDLDRFVENMDSIQKGIVRSMVDKLTDALRRLDTLDEALILDCAKMKRREVLQIYRPKMSKEEFQKLWLAARKVANQMFQIKLLTGSSTRNKKEAGGGGPHSKPLRNDHSEGSLLPGDNPETKKPPPPSYGESLNDDDAFQIEEAGDGEKKTPRLPLPSCNDDATAHDTGTDAGVISPARSADPQPNNGTAAHETKTVDTQNGLWLACLQGRMEELYDDAVAKIMDTAFTQRYLPLQSILDQEWSNLDSALSAGACVGTITASRRKDVQDTWKRIVLKCQQLFRQRQQLLSSSTSLAAAKRATAPKTKTCPPMDWSFLFVGPSHDYRKTEEYLTTWDIHDNRGLEYNDGIQGNR